MSEIQDLDGSYETVEVTEEEYTEDHGQVSAGSYRLVCEACTGIAEVTSDITQKGAVLCKVCGKETPRKRENYIAL